jgi:hypothetical protein
MLKISFLNIIFYFFIKYVALYVLMMFKNNNYAFLEVSNIKSGQDLFYYLWMFLFLPMVNMILFSAPLYYSLKTNSVLYFLLIIAGYLVAEYFVYTYLASQKDLTNGVYNGIISIAFLLLFFYKPISSIFR